MPFGGLLELHDVSGKGILLHLKDHRRSFRGLGDAQVIAILRLSHDHHVRDAELASCGDKVLQRILFRLLELQGRVRRHQVSHVLEQLTQVDPDFAALDDERLGHHFATVVVNSPVVLLTTVMSSRFFLR